MPEFVKYVLIESIIFGLIILYIEISAYRENKKSRDYKDYPWVSFHNRKWFWLGHYVIALLVIWLNW